MKINFNFRLNLNSEQETYSGKWKLLFEIKKWNEIWSYNGHLVKQERTAGQGIAQYESGLVQVQVSKFKNIKTVLFYTKY